MTPFFHDRSHATSFTVLTYNVHSCIGRDRKLNIKRITDVIAESRADIVLLQELDVGRARTQHTDQAQEIANLLGMTPHFHPALHVEEGQYGDAILTAFPSRCVRASALPSLHEPRGALWVEISIAGRPLQVINTHLGLARRERMLQTQALLGSDWLGHPDHSLSPVILGGDFNAVPHSSVFKTISRHLRTGQGRVTLRATFPARFPLLRLDHLFYGRGLQLENMATLQTALTAMASDHLPLIGRFRFALPYNSAPE